MSRDHRLYLDDIAEAIRRIREFTHGMDLESFKADIRLRTRSFEIWKSSVKHPGGYRNMFVRQPRK